MFSNINITELLISLPAVLLALTVHEVSHGYMAMKLGDPTARNLGRLTLNPLKHLDPIGTICMILFRFGWARPVPINTRYFKKPRRDMALTALAGPASNILMGFIGVLLYSIFAKVFSLYHPTSDFTYNLQYCTLLFFNNFYFLNLSLAIFNLIPIPPLDGSRIFLTFLPAKYYFSIMKYEKYIMLIFLFLLWTNIITLPLSKLIIYIAKFMFKIVGLLPFI